MNLEPKPAHRTRENICRFLLHTLETSGCRGVVIGLSGGLDSAVVARLAVLALGRRRVHTAYLPDARTRGDADGVAMIARGIGTRHRTVDINRVEKAVHFVLAGGPAQRGAAENVKSRIRMMILYAIANDENLLVLGTSNKSELLTGYFTKFGDGACDKLPIGDLYKTQVYALARELDIDPEIIAKKPSANLRPGQTDEQDLGMDYSLLDRILHGIELGLDADQICRNAPAKRSQVLRAMAMVERGIHKRETPHVPKLGLRTIGIDWRD